MDQVGTVLVVSGEVAGWRDAIAHLTDELGYRVLGADSADEAGAILADVHVDLVLADQAIAELGAAFLASLRISRPDVIRVLVVDAGEQVCTDTVTRAAIYQYVRRPLDVDQLGLVVKRGLEQRELARRHRLLSREFKVGDAALHPHARPEQALPATSQRFEKLVYASERMVELCALARKAARTELPILIQGETGTGKELLARAVHYNSSRHTSPLMVQNCGGMPDELLQSELFGHRRGAFTGAISDRLGLFRAADGGTVFLDEISEVSASFQVSLLRFLQEGEVKPLGADRIQTCNVRIIAASNRPLDAMVAKGQFRQDLYFRLRGFEFEIPPLRDRRDDIPALAEFFAAKHSAALGRQILGISAGALDKLTGFDFPGNVRELDTELHRMVALARDGEYLTTQNMSPAILAAAPARPARHGNGFVPQGATLKDRVESLEKHLVGEALARHRWNQSRAAGELGLSRVGLANKIRRYGLDHTG